VGLNTIHDADEPGYNMRGAVNVPVGEKLAFRASAFRRINAGYIDNITTGVDDVNKSHVWGVQTTALWQMPGDWTAKVNAFYQDTTGNSYPEVDVLPGVGDLEQTHIMGAGHNNKTLQAYSANVHGDIGGIEVTSLTGYSSIHYADVLDDKSILAAA